MSQYLSRKKALNRKRDEMLDLFTNSRIKLANKPIVYGEFYNYVIDLDHPPKQKAKPVQPLVKSIEKTAPLVPEAVKAIVEKKATQKPAPIKSKIEGQQDQTAEDKRTLEEKVKQAGSFWDSYSS